jgi:hypothetical protein
VFNQCLHKSENKNQAKKITTSELEYAYVKLSQSRLQVWVKCLGVSSVHFSVYDDGNEPPDMDLEFDKLRVVGKGLSDWRILSRLFLWVRHRRVTTKRELASRPESIGPGVRWGGLGVLHRPWIGGGTCGFQTRSSFGRRGRSSTSARGTLCTTWAQGLQGPRHYLFSVGSRGLVCLWRLTIHILCRRVRTDILRYYAQRFID